MEDGVFFGFICLIIGLLSWVIISGIHQREVFNGWAYKCRVEYGGEVQLTRADFWDCYIDGKVFVLPGYEQYQ